MNANRNADRSGAAQGRQETEVRLRRVLTLGQAVGVGVGGTIGGGIFVLVGAAAGRAGPGALLAFLLAFVVALLIAVPYAELACRFPAAGGGYAFAREVLGREWGFVMGWGFWGAYVFISGYITLGFGGYLHVLTGLPPVAGALGLIAASAAVNLAGIRLSATAQAALVLVAIGGLVGFSLAALPDVHAAHLWPPFPMGFAGVLSAALLAFLAFGGFDMIAAAGEEVQRPDRNLPLAILLTLAVALGLYLLVTVVALGVTPWPTLGASRAPLADAAAGVLGPAGRSLVAAAALLTTAATGNAVLVVTSRIAFAMARDGLLPEVLAAVRPRRSVPAAAVAANAVLLGLVALAGSIHIAIAVGGFLYVGHFVPPLVALGILRHRDRNRSYDRHRDGGSPAFRTPAPAVLLPLALAACAVLIATSGLEGILGALGWLTAGLLLHRLAALRARTRHSTSGPDPLGGSRSRSGHLS